MSHPTLNLKQNKLALCLVLPFVLLMFMLVQPLMTVTYGTAITLATKPVDPRDLFRGDYVMLSLAIQEVDLKATPIKGIKDPYALTDKNVFVALRPQNNLYVVSSVSLTPPDSGPYLKGRISAIYSDNATSSNLPADAVNANHWKATVDYGIDSYYVPEGTGTALENMARQGALKATVKVYNGYGVIQKIEALK